MPSSAQHSAASRAGESEEQAAAEAILHGLGNGLLDLNTLSRTLSVLSCLERTWNVLENQVISPVMQRFEPRDFYRLPKKIPLARWSSSD